MRFILPPPVVGLLVGAAMWLLNRQLDWLSFAFPYQTHIAAVSVILGLVIDLNAVRGFFKAKTTLSPFRPGRTERLVTGGLYRFSRNPMYLGLLLILAGWGIWLGNPANIVLLAVYVAVITQFQIRPEEAALHRKFGQPYAAYCARVRRWL